MLCQCGWRAFVGAWISVFGMGQNSLGVRQLCFGLGQIFFCVDQAFSWVSNCTKGKFVARPIFHNCLESSLKVDYL